MDQRRRFLRVGFWPIVDIERLGVNVVFYAHSGRDNSRALDATRCFCDGALYEALGSYTMARRIGVALGLAGGIIQVAFALIRPSQPPVLRTA